MKFNQQVTFELTDPSRSPVTVEEYDAFPTEQREYYKPDYRNYRSKKVRDYDSCYECGTTRFVGWVTVQVPVGNPYRYVPAPSLTKSTMDRINSSNVLMARSLGRQLYGKDE